MELPSKKELIIILYYESELVSVNENCNKTQSYCPTVQSQYERYNNKSLFQALCTYTLVVTIEMYSIILLVVHNVKVVHLSCLVMYHFIVKVFLANAAQE